MVAISWSHTLSVLRGAPEHSGDIARSRERRIVGVVVVRSDCGSLGKRIVIRIFVEYAEGLSPAVIARTLNKEGVPSPRVLPLREIWARSERVLAA
ncbi:MAG: recombinase family protein [Deltaproteobacteria bacterium]|nr:recombinase family protein [Deltaproteobacteria bacterium]